MAQKTHYDVLGVSPKATKPDLDKAYLAKKTSSKLKPEELWELERAYASLSDPNLKRKYDAELAAPKSKGGKGKDKAGGLERERAAQRAAERRRARPRNAEEERRRNLILGAVSAVLFIATLAVVWPKLAWRVAVYDPGTSLVSKLDGEGLGEIKKYDSSHRFPSGVTAPAYLVVMSDSVQEQWLSKDEVNQLYEPSGR